jgi:hypothetical protein
MRISEWISDLKIYILNLHPLPNDPRHRIRTYSTLQKYENINYKGN